MKYGANTKWCTTTESGQYYARYSSRGVLIYNINKKTGYKVACFKNLSPDHDNEFSWWDVTDKKIEVLDSEAPAVVLEAVRNEIKNYPCYNSHLMSENEQEKLHYYKEGIQQSQMHGLHTISDSRMHITGGLNYYPSTGTSTTLTTGGSGGIINAINNNGYTVEYNPSTFTTTADNVLRFSATQESLNEDLERRLFADLTREMNGDDRIAADAQQRLDDAMAEQLAEANERVAQKHLSLLDNKAAEQARIEREALLEQINIDMAEQPVVPLVEKKRKSGKSWINKLWSRLN